MSESISITNPALTYVSIYEESGERVTSYVIGVHGETVEELKELANNQYPNFTHVVQDALTYNNALQHDLLYRNGEYVPRPEPTEDEKREAALTSLDAEYANKISDTENEMAKAQAVGDTDYFTDLKAEREELVHEYTEKRGEI